MTEDELIAALRTLKPMGELPGLGLYRADLLEAAGIDLAELGRWASAHGGGPLEAGQLKLRKGQRPQEGRPGRPQAFYAVPLSLIR
ncbi:MAG: hypothetical protein Q7T55_12215 [Solirubrobacteraceae bacterium]|nr:hypothetical protein [Solirubrobacteraceae bacterium]